MELKINPWQTQKVGIVWHFHCVNHSVLTLLIIRQERFGFFFRQNFQQGEWRLLICRVRLFKYRLLLFYLFLQLQSLLIYGHRLPFRFPTLNFSTTTCFPSPSSMRCHIYCSGWTLCRGTKRWVFFFFFFLFSHIAFIPPLMQYGVIPLWLSSGIQTSDSADI